MTEPEGQQTSARWAAWAFTAIVVAAFAFYLSIGKRNWFFLDEWDFLADRSITSPDDLLRPHNEHWSTLPVLAYRALWSVFGVRTYIPYVAAIVVMHLVAAVLLRVVMRRAGVHPWLATAAAGLFVLLGSGFQNILWAFQIGFVGSLVFGLGHLLLADHEGGFDRRDALGLVCGLAALMCSGVGVTLVAVVGLAVLVRRGWRLAIVHTVPPAAAFGAWWLAFGRDSYSNSIRPSLSGLVDFVATALSNAVQQAGSIAVVAVILVAALVIGAFLVLSDPTRRAERTWAAPYALAVGAVIFATITGIGRAGAFGSEAAKPSRYVHLLAAMLLPAIALGADAIARRWRFALPVLALVLVAGVPGNVDEIRTTDTPNEGLLRGNPQLVKTLPLVDVARRVPRSVQPDRVTLPGVTIGWLRSANRAGKLDDPDRLAPKTVGIARTRLALEQVRDASKPADCSELSRPVRLELRDGGRFRVLGGNVQVRMVEDGEPGPIVTYIRSRGSALVARLPEVDLLVAPPPGQTLLRCG